MWGRWIPWHLSTGISPTVATLKAGKVAGCNKIRPKMRKGKKFLWLNQGVYCDLAMWKGRKNWQLTVNIYPFTRETEENTLCLHRNFTNRVLCNSAYQTQQENRALIKLLQKHWTKIRWYLKLLCRGRTTIGEKFHPPANNQKSWNYGNAFQLFCWPQKSIGQVSTKNALEGVAGVRCL